MAFGSKKFSELVKDYKTLSEDPFGRRSDITKLEKAIIDKMQRKGQHEEQDVELLYKIAINGTEALGGDAFINLILSDPKIQDPYIQNQRDVQNIKSYKNEIENYKKLLSSGAGAESVKKAEENLIKLTKKALKVDSKHPLVEELYNVAYDKRPEFLVEMAADKEIQIGKLQGVQAATMGITSQPATFVNITKSLSPTSNEFGRIRDSMGAENVSDIGLKDKKDLQEKLLKEYPMICGVVVNKFPEKNEYGKFLKNERDRELLEAQYTALESLRSDVRSYIKDNVHDVKDLDKSEVKQILLGFNKEVLEFTKGVFESREGMAGSVPNVTKQNHLCNIREALDSNNKKALASTVHVDKGFIANSAHHSSTFSGTERRNDNVQTR